MGDGSTMVESLTPSEYAGVKDFEKIVVKLTGETLVEQFPKQARKIPLNNETVYAIEPISWNNGAILIIPDTGLFVIHPENQTDGSLQAAMGNPTTIGSLTEAIRSNYQQAIKNNPSLADSKNPQTGLPFQINTEGGFIASFNADKYDILDNSTMSQLKRVLAPAQTQV